MEKRTSSPYPRTDRLVLAFVGVVLVIGTALFMWSDRAHDWRYYQAEFQQMVGERLGADRVRTVPSGSAYLCFMPEATSTSFGPTLV